MISVSLRDLQWRRRRFVMVVVVAALAFGLALVMSGVVNQLSEEGRQTVQLFGADRWVVAEGVSGPFTSSQLIDRDVADQVAATPGVIAASPLLIGRTAIGREDVNIVGYDPASTMLPAKLADARRRAGDPNGAIADVALDRAVGDELTLGGTPVPIVALVEDTSFFFSAPTVFLPLPVVQRLLFAGQDVASAVVVQGDLSAFTANAASVDVLTNDDVRSDFQRVIKGTTDTIGIVNVLLWLMAAGTMAAIVYVGVLERTTDFATLKAIGASTSGLFGGLVAQTALVAGASAAAAVGVCRAISPAFSFPVSVPDGAYLQLIVIALVVGVLASLAGIRKISRIDPTLAFGGAS